MVMLYNNRKLEGVYSYVKNNFTNRRVKGFIC